MSVEHLLLAMIDTASRELKELFRTYNITKEGVLQALSAIRGNQRVTSDNPEETYDALKKYGSDLVERARQIRGPGNRPGTTRSATSSRQPEPQRARTTLCSSVSRAWARPPSPRDWPSGS